MNFQSMEYFAAVAKNRSFTRAADALHITQQTIKRPYRRNRAGAWMSAPNPSHPAGAYLCGGGISALCNGI